MPSPIDPASSLHSLYMSGQPMGVECRQCGRRSTVFTKDKVEGFRGSMRLIETLRLKCSSCGSRDWQGWKFLSDAETEEWRERPLGGPSF
jgi:hypothetical protein